MRGLQSAWSTCRLCVDCVDCVWVMCWSVLGCVWGLYAGIVCGDHAEITCCDYVLRFCVLICGAVDWVDDVYVYSVLCNCGRYVYVCRFGGSNVCVWLPCVLCRNHAMMMVVVCARGLRLASCSVVWYRCIRVHMCVHFMRPNTVVQRQTIKPEVT